MSLLKYQELFYKIEKLIQNGSLVEGEKIPSIRALAEQYNYNKSTVIQALKLLQQHHLIYGVPKSGYYVVRKDWKGKIIDEENTIDFATSAPNWFNFPYNDFQHCINRAIDTYQKDLFIYGTPKGLPSLVLEIQKQLQNYQVFTNLENILITSGIQQALFILTAMPFPNHKKVILVEQPTYHLYLELLDIYKTPVMGIQRTARGIDLEELEKLFSCEDIKFFYTMPRFHNPLGTSYSRQEKEAIVKLAQKYDVYIVEDDYLVDFEQDKKANPVFYYDIDDRVIYLKSFSKIMFPGLRVGGVVLPKLLVNSFQEFKKVSDIDSSMISQAALEIYLKSGMFEKHKNKIQHSYLERSSQLFSAINKYIPNNYGVSQSNLISMHTHITLPRHVNVNLVIQKLSQKNVLIESTDRNYINNAASDKILKINVSNVDKMKIDEGIKLVMNEVNNKENFTR